MSPGLPVEKFVLSHSDLRQHREDVHSYSTADIVTAMSKESGFETPIRNLKSKKHETLRDLLCFGNAEVRAIFSLCLSIAFTVISEKRFTRLLLHVALPSHFGWLAEYV